MKQFVIAALVIFSCIACNHTQSQNLGTPAPQRPSEPKVMRATQYESKDAGNRNGLFVTHFARRRLSLPIRTLEAKASFSGYSCLPVVDRHEASRLISRTKAILQRFPPSFLAQCLEKGGLEEIVIANSIDRESDHSGWGGLCQYLWAQGTARRSRVIVTPTSLAGILSHELAHSFDWANGLIEPEDQNWERANPSGFSYMGSAATNDSATPDGFAQAYGRTDVAEDRATVFEALLSSERDAFLSRALGDTGLRRKVDIWIRRLPQGRLPWMTQIEHSKYGRSGTWRLAQRPARLSVQIVRTLNGRSTRARVRAEGLTGVQSTLFRLPSNFRPRTIRIKTGQAFELDFWKECTVTATVHTSRGPVHLSVRLDP